MRLAFLLTKISARVAYKVIHAFFTFRHFTAHSSRFGDKLLKLSAAFALPGHVEIKPHGSGAVKFIIKFSRQRLLPESDVFHPKIGTPSNP